MADESNALVPLSNAELAAALTDEQLERLPEDALPGVAVERRLKRGRKPLTDAEIRRRALIVQALQFQGYRIHEIAKVLKSSRQTVWRAIQDGKRLGIAEINTTNDIIRRVDDECLPLALEGLKHHLLKRDKDVVMKTLEGRGVLVSHSAVKTTGGAGGGSFKLVIQQGDNGKVGVMGQAVGVPRVEDAE